MSDTEQVDGSDGREFTPRNILTIAGCVLGLTVNLNIVFTASFSAFLKPISAETGWNRAEVALGHSISAAAMLLMLPWIGRLCDQFGSRNVLIAGGPAFAIALAGLGMAPANHLLYLACCVMIGITGATTCIPLYLALLPRLFRRRLGLAVGIASMGAAIGMIAIPIVSQHLILSLGWRGAYIALGGITAAILVPVALFMLGQPGPGTPTTATISSTGRAFRSREFWRIASTYFLTGLAISGFVVHLIPLLTDRDMSATDAALLASLAGLSSLVSRFAAGVLLDYVDAGGLGAACFAAAAGGMILVGFDVGIGWTMAGILLIGVAMGAEGDIIPYVTREVFGARDYGAAVSDMSAVYAGGVLCGPFIAAVIFDATGDYGIALTLFGALSAIAAVIHAPVTRRHRARASG